MTRHKILIVDDQDLVRTVLAKLIRKAGYGALTAADGEEAIELYRLQNPTLVISDIKMPRMNGLALLKEIKKIDERALVILITGFGNEEILLQALRGGAINFFKKPLNVEELIDVINHAVRHREALHTSELATESFVEEEKRFVLCPGSANLLPVINQLTLNFGVLFPDAEIINLKIGIEEMINNAIEHGCLGIGFEEKNTALRGGTYHELVRQKLDDLKDSTRRVHIDSRVGAEGVRIVIRDDGDGFSWKNLPDLSKENLLQYNGRGIFLTKIFFDRVEYNQKGNEVTLEKKKKQLVQNRQR